jgi:hypothetical protein
MSRRNAGIYKAQRSEQFHNQHLTDGQRFARGLEHINIDLDRMIVIELDKHFTDPAALIKTTGNYITLSKELCEFLSTDEVQPYCYVSNSEETKRLSLHDPTVAANIINLLNKYGISEEKRNILLGCNEIIYSSLAVKYHGEWTWINRAESYIVPELDILILILINASIYNPYCLDMS